MAPLTPIQCRAATRSDLAFLAAIDEIASRPPFERSFWDEVLEDTRTATHAFLAAVYAEDASRWGRVEQFLILEGEGQPLAACVVFEPPTGDDRRSLDLDRLPRVAHRLGWPRASLELVVDRWNAWWPREDGGTLDPQAPVIIECVGVIEAARGRGLGRRLMHEAFAVARGRGHDTIGISVVHGNERARALYESVGFRPWASYHAAYYDDDWPGFTKYVRSLAEPTLSSCGALSP